MPGFIRAKGYPRVRVGHTLVAALLLFVGAAPAVAQPVVLSADGQTDTYTLINRTLGGTAEETPDCSHPDFGPHITQQFDADLDEYVFAFWIHVTPDNDRCINFDRQRNEIKTYGPSPDYLKGFLGDTVTFRWAFKLDDDFQPSPSFTHIHQIKAGDGDDAAPIITITPRTGNPDFLQIIHTDSAGHSATLSRADLQPVKGVWIQAYEQLHYSTDGSYSLTLTSLFDGSQLMSVSSDDIDLWRTGTTFVRPKWGIYRSLNNADYLRDEVVLFADFCLAKGSDACDPTPSLHLTRSGNRHTRPDRAKVRIPPGPHRH